MRNKLVLTRDELIYIYKAANVSVSSMEIHVDCPDVSHSPTSQSTKSTYRRKLFGIFNDCIPQGSW